MNLAETAGGSSRKAQENGDAVNDSERPLKKARFAWQVKGKYHLKNDAKDAAKASTASVTEPDMACSSDHTVNDNTKRGTGQNLELIEDYLLKRDFNTEDSVDQSILTPEQSISHEKLPYPTYVSSYEQNIIRNGIKRVSESDNDLNMLPMSMVVSQNFSEEQCIARWQAKQMVKGFVDNSINHILDFWIQQPPPPENEPSRYIALDVADFINNLPGDNSVENEGILMAISAHGLQNAPSSSSSSDLDDHHLNNIQDDSDNLYPLISLPSDDESHENINNNNSDTDTCNNNLDMSWTYMHDNKDENDLSLFPDASLSYQDDINSDQNSSAECGVHNPVDNDCDFLDAAILFAIQSKGLTAFGSDYG